MKSIIQNGEMKRASATWPLLFKNQRSKLATGSSTGGIRPLEEKLAFHWSGAVYENHSQVLSVSNEKVHGECETLSSRTSSSISTASSRFQWWHVVTACAPGVQVEPWQETCQNKRVSPPPLLPCNTQIDVVQPSLPEAQSQKPLDTAVFHPDHRHFDLFLEKEHINMKQSAQNRLAKGKSQTSLRCPLELWSLRYPLELS